MSALDQFAALALWVRWKIETRKGKPTKVPYAPGSNRRASSTDPSTWGTRAEAERGKASFDGVGIILAALDGARHLGGIDLDACISDEGDVAAWARDIVELVDSYTEVSPSGHGLKIYFTHDPRLTLIEAKAKKWRGAVRLGPANGGGKSPGIEFYLRDRYFAVTDQTFEHFDTIRLVDLDTLREVQRRMAAATPKPKPQDQARRRDCDDQQVLLDAIAHIPNPDLHWDQWNTIGMAIFAATEGSAQGFAAFLGFSSKASMYDRAACDERWEAWHTSPPDRLSAGTIFHEAKAAGWHDPRKRRVNGHDTSEPTGESEPIGWAAFEFETKRLAKLDMLAYQRERKDIAGKLKVSLSFLDKQVEAVRNPPKERGLPEIEPWPDAVDGATLLDEIKAAILRHVRVPTRAEEAMALWILFAHCFDAAAVSPRLAITSPMPECGKTTTLELINSLVPRAVLASNLSTSVVYRMIEKMQPTLIIDEADTFLPENEELRGVLNSGHKRGAASVWRNVGDNHEPTPFSTWCPMAIALIGKLPPTLASRSIHVELQRLRRGEIVEPFRLEKAPYADLARKAARWALDNLNALRGVEPAMPEGFMNRRADNWRPLFAVADRAGGAWPELAREAALTLNHVDAGEDIKAMLLADIRAVFGGGHVLSSTELVEALKGMEDRPWPEFGRSKKPISTHAVARLLKPLGIGPHRRRDGSSYLIRDFAEAFERYLPPDQGSQSATVQQSPTSSASDAPPQVPHDDESVAL
jgi:putative DNA primase/helicase